MLNLFVFQAIQSNLSVLISDKFYDQYLFNLLTLLIKLLNECKLFTGQYNETINEIFGEKAAWNFEMFFLISWRNN